MPRVKAGELSLTEIRNLARQHNKASTIKNIDKKNRGDLINEIESMGYKIDHQNKKIVKGGKELSVGKEGDVKPQKRTKRKMLIRQGSAPVLVPEGKVKPPPIPPNRKGKRISPSKEKARENLKKGY
jgi:hypothetical protein